MTSGADVRSVELVNQNEMKKLYHYEKLSLGVGSTTRYIPISEKMLNGYQEGANPETGMNYAYHIHITNAPVGAGDIRLDWVSFYEGHPGFKVYE